jgi:hypothetical protein
LFAYQNPGAQIWVVAVTHEQASDLYWNPLVTGLKQPQPPLIPQEHIKKQDNGNHTVILKNGSVIQCKGSQNADALLGAGLDLLILDEFQSQNPEVWFKLRPMLSDRNGRCYILGTPRGHDHFYDHWKKGDLEATEKLDDWRSWHVITKNAGTIDPAEVEQARADMSPNEFRQEYEASFLTLEGLVYPEFNTTEHVTDKVVYNPALPVLVGWDFNVGWMACVLMQRVGEEVHVFDELHLRNTTTKQMCAAIRAKFPQNRIIAHPDPSGSARDTTGDIVGTTDFSIMTGNPFNIIIELPTYLDDQGRAMGRDIIGRVNVVNWAIKDALGKIRLKIHPRCKYVIRAFQGQTFLKGEPNKKEGGEMPFDATMDAIGYGIRAQYKPKPKKATMRTL